MNPTIKSFKFWLRMIKSGRVTSLKSYKTTISNIRKGCNGSVKRFFKIFSHEFDLQDIVENEFSSYHSYLSDLFIEREE